MKIGIILSIILGLLLLIIGGIAHFTAKRQDKKCKWCMWVLLAGVCALITASSNVIRFLI